MSLDPIHWTIWERTLPKYRGDMIWNAQPMRMYYARESGAAGNLSIIARALQEAQMLRNQIQQALVGDGNDGNS